MLRVLITAELIEVEHGVWCPSCALPSAIVAHLVTVDTPEMLAVDVPFCPQHPRS